MLAPTAIALAADDAQRESGIEPVREAEAGPEFAMESRAASFVGSDQTQTNQTRDNKAHPPSMIRILLCAVSRLDI